MKISHIILMPLVLVSSFCFGQAQAGLSLLTGTGRPTSVCSGANVHQAWQDTSDATNYQTCGIDGLWHKTMPISQGGTGASDSAQALMNLGAGTINSGTKYNLGYYSATGRAISSSTTITTDAVGRLNVSTWQPSGLMGFGDSTCVGEYSGNSNSIGGYGELSYFNSNYPGGVLAYTVKPSDPLSYSTGAGYCQNGAYDTDVAQLQIFPLGPWKYASTPSAILDYGLNDAGHYSSSYQYGVDSAADLANETRILIPSEQWEFPGDGQCVSGGSGTWSINTTRIGTLAPTWENNTNGGTLSCTITTSGTNPIVIQYEALDNNSGAATVTIDGTSTGVTLQSGNSCTTPSSSSGLCIYTAIWNTNSTPQATMFTPASGAGSHTVLLTVSGATGSGMGFSFIGIGTPGIPINPSVATNPTSTGPPTIYHDGVLRIPGYSAGGLYDTFDALYQANITALQVESLPIYYVCGIAGDYASFPATAGSVQPQGCSDVTSFYLDNTYMNVSTTAYSSTTGLLTVVLQAAVPNTVNIGDKEIIASAVTESTINTTTYWNVKTISGSTLVLKNPTFTGTTWSATSDTSAIVSKHFYASPHPNQAGYYQKYKAFNHYINAMGGGVPSPNPPSNLNLARTYVTASYAATGKEGLIEAYFTTASQSITLPKTPGTNSSSTTILPNNGPITIHCNTSSSFPCFVAGASGVTLEPGFPSSLNPGSSVSACAINTPNEWGLCSSTIATSINLECIAISSAYTMTGSESCIRGGSSSVFAITIPGTLGGINNGLIPIFNTGTAAITLTAGSGANFNNMPPSIGPGGGAIGLGLYGNTHYYALWTTTGGNTVVSCSTSGSITFAETVISPNKKEIMAVLTSCDGTASFTYPVAFTETPDSFVGTTASGATASAISTTAVTITSASSGASASSGTIMLESY